VALDQSAMASARDFHQQRKKAASKVRTSVPVNQGASFEVFEQGIQYKLNV